MCCWKAYRASAKLRFRCLLLRGDMEYRLAMQQSPESRLNATARYNVEVVKLNLSPPHSEAPGSQAAATEVDDTSAEDIALKTRMAGKQENTKPQSQDRDW